MMYKENFGVLINTRENLEGQLKLFSEGIKFKGEPILNAEPSRIPLDTKKLEWKVFDEKGEELATLIFMKLSEENNFIVKDGESKELNDMLYYSVKVNAVKEVFVK